MCTIDIKTQTQPNSKGNITQNAPSEREVLTAEIARLLSSSSLKALRCVYTLLLRMG